MDASSQMGTFNAHGKDPRSLFGKIDLYWPDVVVCRSAGGVGEGFLFFSTVFIESVLGLFGGVFG